MTKVTDIARKGMVDVYDLPGGYRYDLICLQEQFPLSAGRVFIENLVHYKEQLLNPLILPQILAPLHQVVVVFLIIPADCYTLRFP